MGLLLCIVVILLGCQGQAAGGRSVALGKDDNGKSVALAAGDALALTLAANPTTGYTWEIAACDPALLALEQEDFTPDAPELTGSGGLASWRFRAIAPGTTTLRLVYRRPWEKVEPLETYTVTISVTTR